jgi:hypothetical protein
VIELRAAIPVVFALAAVGLAFPAGAKDVCVTTSQVGTYFKFSKVKLSKKPGASVPLAGSYVAPPLVAPVTGTATTRADGSIVIGVHVHSLASDRNDFASTMIGDTFFTASGNFRDIDPPVVNPPNGWTWTSVDCRTVPIPPVP